MKEQIRSKLESQGIDVDKLNLIEDYDKLNVKLDDDEQESSDDAGSDSSADDGLPLHLERFAKVCIFQPIQPYLSLSLPLLSSESPTTVAMTRPYPEHRRRLKDSFRRS